MAQSTPNDLIPEYNNKLIFRLINSINILLALKNILCEHYQSLQPTRTLVSTLNLMILKLQSLLQQRSPSMGRIGCTVRENGA